MSDSLTVTVSGIGTTYDLPPSSIVPVTYDVLNYGTLVVPPDLLSVATGTLVALQGFGILNVSASLISLDLADFVQFSNGNNVVEFTSDKLLNGLNLAGTGFATDGTDSLAVTDGNTITASSYSDASGSGILSLTFSDGTTAAVTLAAGLNPNDFSVSEAYGASILTYNAPCFVRGTRIDTPSGPVAVEDLAIGAEISLARGGSAPVKWIGQRRLRPAYSENPVSVAPIVVAEGALGGGLPRRPLRVSPDHALFLDGVLVPAGLLVNGTTITSDLVELVEYFHVELERHDVILAEGAAAETYLDTGNRSTFANTPLVTARPVLDGSLGADGSLTCAPMLLDGPRLDVIRARLNGEADRAAPARRVNAA